MELVGREISLDKHEDLLRAAFNNVLFGNETKSSGVCLSRKEWEKRVTMITQIKRKIPVSNAKDKNYYGLAKKIKISVDLHGNTTLSEIGGKQRLLVHQEQAFDIIRDSYLAAGQKGLCGEHSIHAQLKDHYKNVPRSMVSFFLQLLQKDVEELEQLVTSKLSSQSLPLKPPSVAASLDPEGQFLSEPQPTPTEIVPGRILQSHSILGGRIKVSKFYSWIDGYVFV
jgi:hypothetical protein